MKRKIFFLFDRLQVKKSERILISSLMILICLLSAARIFINPHAYVDPVRQAHLDKVFTMRSQQYHSERAELLARYEPYLVRVRVDEGLYPGSDSGSEAGLSAGSWTGSRAGPETGSKIGSRDDAQAGDPSEDRNRAWTNTQTRDPTEAWTGTSVKPQLKHDTAVTFRVNINSADIDSLILLPGIGPAYARRIIDRRLEIGGFTDLVQLLDVKGIGPARFEKIQPFVEL